MIYNFRLVSGEVENFAREISIDSEATFFDFHKAILESVGYSNEGMTSFFICNEAWEKEREVTLVEMDTASDIDNYVMDETSLDELIEDKGQKLLYVFDNLSDRAFFIQLRDIEPGKGLEAAECTLSKGKAPAQFLESILETPLVKGKTDTTDGLDETFYGDESFDIDELDADGFSDMNFEDDFNSLQ